MNKLLNEIEERIVVKKLIYLVKDDFVLYNDVNEREPIPSPVEIGNKIYEVLDIAQFEKENFYLIGVGSGELGWVSVKNPIFILNSTNEFVTPFKELENSQLNTTLKIDSTIKKGKIYRSPYSCIFEDEVYIGLKDENEFIGFYKFKDLDFGVIDSIDFKFKENSVEVFKNSKRTIVQQIQTKNRSYSTKRVYLDAEIGITKIGKFNYWFLLEDTDIENIKIKNVEKNDELFFLDHLLKSIQNEISVKIKSNSSSNKKEVEIEKKRLAGKVRELQVEKNNIAKSSKEKEKDIKNLNLANTRLTSKLDYYKRLSTNYENKISYYETRTTNLESRLELLEDRLKSVNDKYNELKNSKLVKLQNKIFRK